MSAVIIVVLCCCLMLLAGGGGLLYYYYSTKEKETTTPATTKTKTTTSAPTSAPTNAPQTQTQTSQTQTSASQTNAQTSQTNAAPQDPTTTTTTTTTTTPIPARTYGSFAYTNFGSTKDIRSLTGNIESCKKSCDTETEKECTGFFYSTYADLPCILKNVNKYVDVPVWTADGSYYYVDSHKPVSGKAKRTFLKLNNTDYLSNGSASTSSIKDMIGTPAECQTECDAIANCNGFFHNGTKCWLKNTNKSTGFPSWTRGTYYYSELDKPDAGAAKRPYSSFSNTDFTGQRDIRALAASVEECKIACDAETDGSCTGFYYRSGVEKPCLLKNVNKSTAPTWNADGSYFYVESEKPVAGGATRAYGYFDNTDFHGNTGLGDMTGTLFECKVKCDTTANCNGFYYNGTKCWLKNTDKSAGVPSWDGNGKYYYLESAKPEKGAAATYGSFGYTDYTSTGSQNITDKTGNVAECQRYCDTTVNCNGFFHNGTKCWLKTVNKETGVPSYSSSGTYYYKESSKPNAGAFVPKTCGLSQTEYGFHAELKRGQSLDHCTGLRSPDLKTIFVIQSDGNAVIYKDGISIWNTNSQGKGGTGPFRLDFQDDSNLMLRDRSNKELWSSGSYGKTSTTLKVLDNGRLVLYNGAHEIWSSKDCSDASEYTIPYAGGTLPKNKSLYQCSALQTHNQKTRLKMQPDGNLILYNTNDNKVIWSSGTNGKGTKPYHLDYQSDGNLMLRDGDSRELWSSGTYNKSNTNQLIVESANLVLATDKGKVEWSVKSRNNRCDAPGNMNNYPGDALFKGYTMYECTALLSSNNLYQFNVQTDGNLTVWDKKNSTVKWASNTYNAGERPYRLEFKNDGSLVLYDNHDWSLWSKPGPGEKLVMQDDGNLVLYNKDNGVMWASNWK